MATFNAEDFTAGREIEVTMPTNTQGIWAASSDFYGFGLKGKVRMISGALVTVRLSHTGFYGAYDNPAGPVDGKPVDVIVDLEKAVEVMTYGYKEIIRVTMRGTYSYLD